MQSQTTTSKALTRTAFPGVYSYTVKGGRLRYTAVVTVKKNQRWLRGFETMRDAKAAFRQARTEMVLSLPRKVIHSEPVVRLPKDARQNALAQALIEKGWHPGTSAENRICYALSVLGVGVTKIEQQFNIGPYRLDFAIPSRQIGIEADGVLHSMPKQSERDHSRDRRLAGWGWTVYRLKLDAITDEDLLPHLASILRLNRAQT